MRNKSIRALAAAAALVSLGFAAQNASALPVHNPAVITLNGASVETYDSSASNSANTVNYKFNMGSDHIISSIAFNDIVVTTDGTDPNNWASFLRIELYNSNGDSISDNFGNVSPFDDATYNTTGDVTFANIVVDLSNAGFNLADDGLLYVKFYEDINNPTLYLGAAAGTGLGATIDSGTVTITAVPEPSNIALMMLGLAGMGLVARRRSKN